MELLLRLKKKILNLKKVNNFKLVELKFRKLAIIANGSTTFFANKFGAGFKPGLHKPQLPVERSVTLVSYVVVERRRCALLVSTVFRLQENKET